MITPTDADALAEGLLRGLRTRLGGWHIDHARRVAAAMADHGDRAVIAGLLHDTVEKGRITRSQLTLAVADATTVEIIDALTHRDGERYDEYLLRCAQHPVASLIKRADLLDKLLATDAQAPADVCDRLRAEARDRLSTFDRLAHVHAPVAGGQ